MEDKAAAIMRELEDYLAEYKIAADWWFNRYSDSIGKLPKKETDRLYGVYERQVGIIVTTEDIIKRVKKLEG